MPGHYTAYPTIVLFVAITIIHLFTIDYTFVSFLLHIACCCAQFVVVHDAIHGSISTNKTINNSIGWISQIWMGPFTNFYGFKYVHKQHHSYTNEPERDPDYWTSHNVGATNVIWWMFIDVSYWRHYIPQVIPGFSKRPNNETVIVWVYHICIILGLICAYYYNVFDILWWNWLLPSRISKFILTFAVDYLPHYEIRITCRENKYATAHPPSSGLLLRPILTIIMCYQNYHVAHHANPRLPFWKCSDYFNKKFK